MRRILAATDGSEGAGRAVVFAAELARTTGAALHVLTVGGNLPSEEMSRLAQAERDVGAVLEMLSEQVLKDAMAQAKRSGAPAVESEARWGEPAEAILDAAKHCGADTIVLGRRGLGRLVGLLIGSVSQKVVTLAPCSVIVVP